jgi:hypothetical protein
MLSGGVFVLRMISGAGQVGKTKLRKQISNVKNARHHTLNDEKSLKFTRANPKSF